MTSSFFGAGSSYDFHKTCMNELARSLTHVNRDKEEKEQLLLAHCPRPEDSHTPLHTRALNGVIALGYFALKSKEQCSERVVDYFTKLLLRLPTAVWTPLNKQNDGLMARDFTCQLTLIITSISSEQPIHSQKIMETVVKVFRILTKKLLDIDSQSPEEYCMLTTPTLIGLCMGMTGSHRNRKKMLNKIFLNSKEEEELQETVKEANVLSMNTKQVIEIIKMIKCLFSSSTVLQKGNEYLSHLPGSKSYPFPDLCKVIHCGLLSVLQTMLTNPNIVLDESYRFEILQFSKDKLNSGTQELSTSTGGSRWQEKMLFTVKSMCSATRLLTWSVTKEEDGDSLFLQLSSLLGVHTGKLNVIVSPLRAIILQAIGELACRFPNLINSSLSRFSEFLLSSLYQHMYGDAVSTGSLTTHISSQMEVLMEEGLSSYLHLHISRADAFLVIQQALSRAVCRTLNAASSTGSDHVISFIGSLGNKLYTTNAKEDSALKMAECIIVQLRDIGISLHKTEGVVSRIVGVFQQRLFHPVSSLDGTIINEIGNMAAELGDLETLEILNRLMNEALGMAVTPYPPVSSSLTQSTREQFTTKHKRTESRDLNTSYSHIFEPVMDALVHVASNLKGQEQRSDFLQRVLHSFIQQGIELKRASERKEVLKASSSSFSLGLLLPVLATLCHQMKPIMSPSPKLLKLFRDFWLYCILLGFSDSEKGVFPPNWYKNVRDIAIKSPVLIFSDAEKYLDKELEISHPLKKGDITVGELQEARLALQETLGRSTDLNRLIYQLTFAQCMYLQSIYRLEAVRLEKDTSSFPIIFQYLENNGLQKELWLAIEAIAKKLFDRLLLLLEDKSPTKESERELDSHAVLLMFKFNHLRGRIKRLADHFLSKLVDKFPHLLWSKTVIHTMLDLLQQMSSSIHSLDPDTWIVVDVKLPYTSHTISLPDSVSKREETVINFAKRCGEIIDLALKWTPAQTKAILQNYVCMESNSLDGVLHHSGVSLATSQLYQYEEINKNNKDNPISMISSYPDCIKDTRSQSSSSLVLQSKFLGGIKMATSLNQDYNELTTQTSKQLKNAIAQGSIAAITSSLYSITAILVANEGYMYIRSLLHSLVYLPVSVFREDVVTIATHCWQWLITARPELEYPFMREFSSVWQHTINEQMGMFSRPYQKLRPQHIQPHVVLIDFLSSRFDVINTRSSSLINLIGQLLHHSLTVGVGPSSNHPQRITPSIATCTARFRLLNLAVQLLRGRLIANGIDRTLLREKIYNAALDYFCYSPSWIVGDIKTVREAMVSMIKFWEAVKEIKNTLVINPLSSSDLTPTPIPRNSSFWQALATDGPSVQGSWLNTLSSRSSSLGKTSLSVVPNISNNLRSTTNSKSRVLLKRRNLILSLMRHEVERLNSWQNPNGVPELMVPGEDLLSSWLNPTQSERNWKNTVTMAYQASPFLAFYVYYRFKTNEFVVRELYRLVQLSPVLFVDIPEAAQLLARKEAVERDAPELYHLLYWRNIPPAIALMYFTKPYSNHPITAQFANKAMTAFNPGEILLYIPQIVQALRYDKLGFARNYILSATKTSQLLAHQFLWNIQANMYSDEEGEVKDPEIGAILELLSQEIINSLSGSSLKFYEREFSFFKKVTDISGVIRPFPKSQRKNECLKALKQIQLEPGVYLPSNPDSVVLEIDYESGTPLQSAAKAPFLAKFRVRQCGISEMEELNTRQDTDLVEAMETFSQSQNTFWQGSIFKVGDDVRQDMLALQIIQLFKDVFDEIGIDLYLVPYRVIATSAGCGVIECVPDSKSRDQLGKQTQVSLKEYFHSIYGGEDFLPYQQARGNFIRSMAAYSLVTYLLQIKDRHNGNIMLNKEGHIIHIDFGFLFESSPGGNLGFEPDLKLTEEMLEVMGGKRSDSYRLFLNLCVQGYLAVRPYMEQVVAMVTLMLDTGFPCFRGNTIEELRTRFRPNFSEKDAARAIIEVVESSCLNIRTLSYDVIQDYQQKIYYHKKT